MRPLESIRARYAQVCLALLLGAAVPLEAAQPAKPDSTFGPFEAYRLVDDVRLLATPPDYTAFSRSNVLIVEQQDGLVVVDSGAVRADGDAIVRYIRSFTTKPVKALIYTHWHNDHLQGASQIRAAWPNMRILATEETRAGIDGPARSEGLGYSPNPAAVAKVSKQLEDGAATADKLAADPAATAWQKLRYQRMGREYRQAIGDFVGTILVAPTEIVRNETLIDDPKVPVRVKFLGRANTDGDAIVWLPNQRLVATGDVVVAPIPFGFGSYPSDWISTLRKIKELGFEVLVPGHGLPQSDSSYVDRLIGALTDLRTQVGKLAAAGLTLDQVRAKVDLSAQSDLFGWPARRKAWLESLWMHPMIENAYKEAKGIPIIQGEGELPGSQ